MPSYSRDPDYILFQKKKKESLQHEKSQVSIHGRDGLLKELVNTSKKESNNTQRDNIDMWLMVESVEVAHLSSEVASWKQSQTVSF